MFRIKTNEFYSSRNKKSLAGFLLVEMLVSVSVFSIIIAIISSFFISSLKTQRIVFMRQEMINQVSFALEYVSRSLRMASKDIAGECIAPKANYELIDPYSASFGGEIVTVGKGIAFKNYSGKCQSFYIDNNGVLWEDKRMPGEPSSQVRLIASGIEISKFVVALDGKDQNDAIQPRVTFAIRTKEKNSSSASVEIETTVSQRNIDVRR